MKNKKPNLDNSLKKLQAQLFRMKLSSVHAERDYHSVVLTGDVRTLEDRVKAGYTAARFGFKGVVNDITVCGQSGTPMSVPNICDNKIEGKHFDVVIIGAGVIGAATARELSRKKLSIAVFEKEPDVAMHASGRNDGMIHTGFADNPKKIKGRYNTRGNRMFDQAAKELSFDIKRVGSFFLFSTPLLKLLVPLLKRRCRQNGVDGHYCGMSKKQVTKIDPYITPIHYGGFWQPSAAVASPMHVTIAYAENAAENGVQFFFNTVVTGMKKNERKISAVMTNRGTVTASVVVNAAGLWADTVAGFAGDRFFSIHGRKGTDIILDKKVGMYQKTASSMPSLFRLKKKHSKGGGLIPCIEGNVLIGPNAQEVLHREDYSTHQESIDEVLQTLKMNTMLSANHIITYYSGVRACTWNEDFIIEPSERIDNLIHAAGIQSPGFASSPAIAHDVAGMAVQVLEQIRPVYHNPHFNPIRTVRPRIDRLSVKEKNALIKRDAAYGKIICRCEHITAGEVRDAMRSPLPVIPSLDMIKRRVRAGAGRCHGSFCMPYVMDIIAEEKHIPFENITKKSGTSNLVYPIGAVDEHIKDTL